MLIGSFLVVNLITSDTNFCYKTCLIINTSQGPWKHISFVQGGREENLGYAKVVYDAIWIYESLRNTLDTVEGMEMIFQVWVEMMIYVAEHSSRDSHARQLSHGGEFITIAWLSLHHLKYYSELQSFLEKRINFNIPASVWNYAYSCMLLHTNTSQSQSCNPKYRFISTLG